MTTDRRHLHHIIMEMTTDRLRHHLPVEVASDRQEEASDHRRHRLRRIEEEAITDRPTEVIDHLRQEEVAVLQRLHQV